MGYWEDRQKELNEKLEKDEEKYKEKVSKYYQSESKKLENNIASYYAKYGENNVIEYRKMMEKLSAADVTLLMEQMDEFSQKYPDYVHLMPIRESMYKLNRLEGLQHSIRMQQLEIGAISNVEMDAHLTKQALRGSNAAMEALGFGKNFYSVNSDLVRSIVTSKYTNGKNFSDSIWGNVDKLSEYLNNDVAQAMARGDSYQNIMRSMKERFETVSRNDMYRLIYTEGTHIMAESTMKPFEEDFEKYEVSTAGDGKVCSTCGEMSGKVFYLRDRQAGVNCSPFHPWCRCSFKIVVENWDEWIEDYVEKHGDSKKAKEISLRFKLDNQMFTKKHLSDKEVALVKTYKGSYSYKINEKLRNNVSLNDIDKKFVEEFDVALKKIPKYEGNVTRDLNFMFKEDIEEFISKIQVNQYISFPQYVSSTTNKVYNETADIRIKIVSKTGHDIREYLKDENEILFERNIKYFVTGMSHEDGRYLITMEEI